MTGSLRFAIACWLTLGWAAVVGAQQPESPPAENAAEKAGTGEKTGSQGEDASAARARFDQVLKQFKSLLGEIRKLQLEYKKVKPAQRPPIKQAFQEKTQRARELLAQLKKLGEEAFRADPSQKEIARFLAVAGMLAARRGQLVEAVRLFELLDSKGFHHTELDPVAGEAAFGLSRYDLAEKFLSRAKKEGKLSPQHEQLLAQLEKEKEYWTQEQKLRQEEAKRGDNDPKALPRVLLRTTKGDILIELFEDQAPNTVANFIHLVEKGFYNGLTFHRVIPGFVAQGGDPEGTGKGGPGYTIPDEHNRPDARRHYWGSVAMARTSEPNSAGSQFYIAYKRLPALDGAYTVFGRVIRGMDVVLRLNPQNSDEKQNELPPDRILSAQVVRKRNHPYIPKVLRPGQSEPVPLEGGTEAPGKKNDKTNKASEEKPPAEEKKDSSAKKPGEPSGRAPKEKSQGGSADGSPGARNQPKQSSSSDAKNGQTKQQTK